MQQSLIAVTFSFQAIETFANEVIGTIMADGRFYRESGTSGSRTYTSTGLQGKFSTQRKIEEALPRLLGVKPIPKDRALWSQFKTLKKLRDETVHLKWENQLHSWQKHGSPDDTSLWRKLINCEIEQQPRTAATVVYHFARAIHPEPTWLPHVIETFNLRNHPSKRERTPGKFTLSGRP